MPAATELICYHISSSVVIMSLTLSCCCDQFNNNYTDDTLAVSLCLINGTGIVLFYTCLPICLPYREGFSKKKNTTAVLCISPKFQQYTAESICCKMLLCEKYVNSSVPVSLYIL